jgi:Protein of unknown function (DUF1579)
MKLLVLCIPVLAFGLAAFALQTPPGGKKGGEPSPQDTMAAMMRAGTPGEQHKALEPFVGMWNAKVSMWMDPASPVMESTGTMVNSWICGGHYMQHKFEGDFGGMKFEGGGLWGFDVAAGKYIGIWYDSMSTSVTSSVGPEPKDGKTFTMASTSTDPMTGKPSVGEEVVTLDNANQHTMTMYEDRGGKKVKTMQVVYTRAK